MNSIKSSNLVRGCVRYEKNNYHVSDRRIKSLLESCHNLLASPSTTARKLSRLAGKVISTKFVLSNFVRLKTRFLYRTIDKKL